MTSVVTGANTKNKQTKDARKRHTKKRRFANSAIQALIVNSARLAAAESNETSETCEDVSFFCLVLFKDTG